MKVLFATSEMTPYASTGGLGAVAGSLPAALAKRGTEVHVIMPYYRATAQKWGSQVEKNRMPVKIFLGGKVVEARFYTLKEESGVTVWFVDIPQYYDREELYVPRGCKDAYWDSSERFAALCKATMTLAEEISPDVLHANDWQTALVPVYLKADANKKGRLIDTKAVLTIHNLRYQGNFWFNDKWMLDLPDEVYKVENLHHYGNLNFLKGGIVYADAVNTVSPAYAEEILEQGQGELLDSVLLYHKPKLSGILNGIDEKAWNPRFDKFLPCGYDESDMFGKRLCRDELAKRMGLRLGEKTAVVGFVGRLDDQKGFGLLNDPWTIERMLEIDAVYVYLAGGEYNIDNMRAAAARNPGRIAFYHKFSEELSRLITAGSDFMLMPSRFEPCGLVQMQALNYGTPVIAHNVGGLKNTIVNKHYLEDEGTGWLFERYDGKSMSDSIREAAAYRLSNPEGFLQMQKLGMKKDFSWSRQSQKYAALYQKITGRL